MFSISSLVEFFSFLNWFSFCLAKILYGDVSLTMISFLAGMISAYTRHWPFKILLLIYVKSDLSFDKKMKTINDSRLAISMFQMFEKKKSPMSRMIGILIRVLVKLSFLFSFWCFQFASLAFLKFMEKWEKIKIFLRRNEREKTFLVSLHCGGVCWWNW